MRASYRWLKELLPHLSAPPAEVARRLGEAGLAVDGVRPFGAGLEALLVVQVLAKEPHPKRASLNLVTIDRGGVELWRCANERSQAQAVAVDIERVLAREGRDGGRAQPRIAVLVAQITHEGQAVGVALEERAIPHRMVGEAAFFQRAEIRDLLAWLRLLADPTDAGARGRLGRARPVGARRRAADRAHRCPGGRAGLRRSGCRCGGRRNSRPARADAGERARVGDWCPASRHPTDADAPVDSDCGRRCD